MAKKVTLYLVRHGKTIFNTTLRVQGWSDTPLTSEGISVVENLGKGLRDITFTEVHCSDSGRARETANVILTSHGQKLTLNENKNLREVCFGSYEGGFDYEMLVAAAKGINYELTNDLQTDYQAIDQKSFLNVIYKNDTLNLAETYDGVQKRMFDTIKSIAQKTANNGGGNVLIISHGMSLGILITHLIPNSDRINNLENASVSKIIYENNTFFVEEVGNTEYIKIGSQLE